MKKMRKGVENYLTPNGEIDRLILTNYRKEQSYGLRSLRRVKHEKT